MKHLLDGRVIAVDTETTGLNPYLGDRLFCYNFANTAGQTLVCHDDAYADPALFDRTSGRYKQSPKDGSVHADLKSGPLRLAVRKWMADPSVVKVFFNAKFDLKMLARFGVQVKGRVHDVMVMAHLLNCQGPAGLEYDDSCLDRLSMDVLSKKYLPEADQKLNTVTEWLKSHSKAFIKQHGRKPSYTDVPWKEVMVPYAAQDPLTTLKLFYMLWPHIKDDEQLLKLYWREMELLTVVRGMEDRGVRLDIPYMKERSSELKQLELEAAKWLIAHTEPITLHKFKSRTRTAQGWVPCTACQAGIECTACKGTKLMPDIDMVEGEFVHDFAEAPPTKAGCPRWKVKTKTPIEIIKQPHEINFGSDDQLAVVLFEQKKLPVMGKTDAGNPSIDERALSSTGVIKPMPALLLRPCEDELAEELGDMRTAHIDNVICFAGPKASSKIVRAVKPTEGKPGLIDTFFADPYCAKIVEWRQYEKLRGTYFDGFMERLPPNSDILHGNFIQIGTNSGRFCSRDPNLQNMPMEGSTRERAGAALVFRGVKEMFIPRDGFTNWHMDYKGVELRTFAHFAQDPIITETLLSGRDIHSEICKRLFGTVSEKLRVLAKIVSFGILYGMGEDAFAWKLQITKEKVKELLAFYYETFPSVKALQQRVIAEIRQTGMIRNAQGRRYLIHPGAAYRGVNYLCQGSAADALKRAMVGCARLLAHCKSSLLMTIHDELVFEVHHSEERWLVPKLAEIMADQPELSIPLAVDVEKAVGNWGGLVKWDVATMQPKQKKAS